MKESTISIILVSLILTTILLIGFNAVREQKCPAQKTVEKIVGACEKNDDYQAKQMCMAKTACGDKLGNFKYDSNGVNFNCNK